MKAVNQASTSSARRRLITGLFTDRSNVGHTYHSISDRRYDPRNSCLVTSDERRKQLFSGEAINTELRNKAAEGASKNSTVASAPIFLIGMLQVKKRHQ